jgi:RNA polymerase sigma-70 factor (ECF subfamily)
LQQENHIIDPLKNKQYDRAVSAISELYHEMLYWHIRKLVRKHQDADDVLQNTYIRIFKGLKSFKFRSSVKTWCFRIAYNESMRLLQKQQKLEYTNGEGDLTDHLNKLTADPYFDLDSVSYAFQESLIKLPEKQQRIFQMKYFDELTFDEIAEITTWNKNSIKTAFYAAKEKIIIHVKATV